MRLIARKLSLAREGVLEERRESFDCVRCWRPSECRKVVPDGPLHIEFRL